MNVENDLYHETIKLHHQPRWSPDLTGETRPEWMSGAACTEYDADTFYPEGKGASARDARIICRTCPVVAECLAYALGNNEHYGVWGGKTERERRNIRRTAARGYTPPSSAA